MRQAVDQVDVDAADAGRAQPVDRPRGLVEALEAVDRGLDQPENVRQEIFSIRLEYG